VPFSFASLSVEPASFGDERLPGLLGIGRSWHDRGAAAAATAWLSREYGLTGTAVDPAEWMTMHIDSSTVRVLADAISHYPSGNDVATGMLEEFQEWLATSRPEDPRA
jgi:hypothetical protein